MFRNAKLLEPDRSGLFIIDIQEKLLKAMFNKDELIKNCEKLIKGCTILELSVFLTEQNPESLGKTSKVIKKAIGEVEPIEKSTFSCCGIDGFINTVRSHKLDQIILCGIESHVCVWQSAMDFISNDFQVVVAKDCTSSRNETDYQNALQRMLQEGIAVDSTEMILFEMLKSFDTDTFKKILELIK